MNYKVEKVVKNFKKGSIAYIIIWLLLTILFVAPMAIAQTETINKYGSFNLVHFMEVFSHVKNPCFFLIIQLKNHTAENIQLNTYG